jgi:hypothetical protein
MTHRLKTNYKCKRHIECLLSMDDLSCCLSQVVKLCIEASIFLAQLSKFEHELAKLYSSYHIPSRKFDSILDRFSTTILDLNLYHKNHFLKLYSNVFYYLSRQQFTLGSSNEIINDFDQNLNRLNSFLNQRRKYPKKLFYCLHKLSITCSLYFQYHQSCTKSELASRFVYIRIDLLTNLKELNEEIRTILLRTNQNFNRTKRTKNEIKISNLFRTIFLWFLILLLIGCYSMWPIVYESEPKQGWPM